MPSKRVEWVDVCKGLAILAIFIGHIGDTDIVTTFVFRYHVQLFFFLSGFFFSKRSGLPIKDYLIKCAYSILVPYFFFCIFNIVFVIVTTGSPIGLSKEYLKQAVLGIRNQIPFGQQLWFLPCLFVIQVIYYLLYKMIKNRFACIAVTFILALVSAKIPNVPSMFFNIDSAVYYMFYYSLGDILYPKLKKFSFSGMRLLNRILVSIISFLVLGSTFYIYCKSQEINLMIDRFSYMISGGHFTIFIAQIIVILMTIILIFANIIISFVLKNSTFLSDLGRNTLTMCGCEWIAMSCIYAILAFFEITFKTDTVLFKIIILILKVTIIKVVFFPLFDKCLPWAIGRFKLEVQKPENLDALRG